MCTFGDHAFQFESAHGGFDSRRCAGQRFGSQDVCAVDDGGQRGATFVERTLQQVAAVEMQQIERVVDEDVRLLMVERLE